MYWILDWLACGLVKLIGGVLCLFPAPVAVWLGERVGSLGYWLRPKRTRIGLSNLRAAFDGALTPAQARRIIRAYYRQLGAGVVELLRLPVIDRAYVDRYVAIEGRRHFDEAIASGKPVILLTGHYGNWELSSIVGALLGFPIMALARAQNNLPRLYRLLVSYRESKGCTIVHKGGAMKRMIGALERGGLIGIVGDQASRQGILVDFFGRPALFATGPFELAVKNGALILPVFTHRVRGPFHRLVIEPPMTCSRSAPKVEAIRAGIEQFAEALAHHISEDPSQWLWLHKRWKHTPARRVLVLSDGKLGHLKQSLAVVEALRAHRPELSSQVVEVRYRHPWGRLLTLLWSWWVPGGIGGERCLSLTLTPKTRAALLGRYADLIVSCGAAVVPANLLWSAENRAKSVVIMNPAPLPLRRFSLVIAPRHDWLPRRSNVVQVAGAITACLRDETLQNAKARLATHPRFRADGDPVLRGPVVAVFIGGDTLHYELSPAFTDALIREVVEACETVNGCHLVTTSRRTSASVEQRLSARLGREPRCRLLLVASRDALNGTMEGMLGSADVAVVTGESISMVSEACASGRPVVVVELPLRQAGRTAPTKHRRFLSDLATHGYVRIVPVSEIGAAIRQALKERQAHRRLDNCSAIRDALRNLL